MSRGVLGIDIGTSSVKALLVKGDKKVKLREEYESIGLDGWTNAIKSIAQKLDMSEVSAIGFSSQVGTYIADKSFITSWNDPAGKKQLDEALNAFPKQKFVDEISMPHPELTSYPIPRLRYIKEQYGDFAEVCQPKDYIIRLLTGKFVTDMYSWRGLANLETARYSKFFLDYIGISENNLPEIKKPTDLAGVTIENDLGFPTGIPVYVGCNDFFASLLGMGINKPGQMFDITGTSEHIGIISDKMDIDTKMVSGPYYTQNVSYGVTASSGASMDFCLANFDTDLDPEAVLGKNPPIFLPYLNGERAPIFDSNAKGMFFGITKVCGKKEMAYAVMEGIAFSLWHIYEILPEAKPNRITVSGGGAVNTILNRLKAELFDIPVVTLCENDTSALGAVILAAIGCGEFGDIFEAAESLVKTDLEFLPTGKFRSVLLKRFETYKKLYPRVKDLF